MFRFQNINYLWLFIIPIIILFLFILSEYIRKKNFKKIGDLKLVNLLIPSTSLKRRIWKIFLIFISFSLIIIALARPQFGSKLVDVSTKGIEIVVSIDVSNSMLSQDIKPNRLDNAKKIVERIINKSTNNKLGLVVFAGDAFIQMPLTDDVRATKMYLQNINPTSVPTQGTAIAAALELSSKCFSSNKELQKVIILITDGENHEDNPIETAQLLKEKNIKIFTVGIGNPKGSPISLSGNKGFLKDKQGNVVMSALDENTLIQISNATNGVYVRVINALSASDQLISELNKIERGDIQKQQYSEYDERFFYFAMFSFILLIIDCIIHEKKSERFSKINLFKNNKKII